MTFVSEEWQKSAVENGETEDFDYDVIRRGYKVLLRIGHVANMILVAIGNQFYGNQFYGNVIKIIYSIYCKVNNTVISKNYVHTG
ncbi:hypothetical protein QE152_g3927 [Popillia japonica]|uniref:Uncharacterized protein n=1 Tax=Popillia japonica TaxID=7064 RepID=A0AAW1N206_POPJA